MSVIVSPATGSTIDAVIEVIRRRWLVLAVFVFAVPFVLRVVEPELVPYFLAPALALLPISAATRGCPVSSSRAPCRYA